MAGPADAIAQKVIKEIGKKAAKGMLRQSGRRFFGHITRNSRVWLKAFEHISEHFKSIPGKSTHSVFEPKFRNKQAIEQLVKKALGGPSRTPILTKLTIGSEPIGTPAVIIEREFPEMIGRADGKDCKILRIIVDITGRPQTAYPVNKFFGAGVAAVVAGSAGAASAAEIPTPVQEAYADEATFRESLIDRACEPKNWAEWVVEILLSPTCSGLDPQEVISSGELEKRIASVITRIEKQTGYALDSQTRKNVATDVKRIWYMGGIDE